MPLSTPEFVGLAFVFFVIATLYSSAGFGGGSSYLALLALVFTEFFYIRSTALICNIAVVSLSCYFYYRRGLLDFKRFMPFVLAGIPLAFIGANFRLKDQVFFMILGLSLIVSAVAMILQTFSKNWIPGPKHYRPSVAYSLGGSVGFLAGLVGIGGGIFLAPILNNMNWDRPVKIAALTSLFIWVNSMAGIAGLAYNDTLKLYWPQTLLLIVAVLLGGWLGSGFTLKKMNSTVLKRWVAVLILFVGFRVFLINGLQIAF